MHSFNNAMLSTVQNNVGGCQCFVVVCRGVKRGAGGKNSQGPKSLWERRITTASPNYFRGRRKVQTMSQALPSIHYICFLKTSYSNMAVLNLLLAPGAIQPRYAPGRIILIYV